jgi:hypothetical protein
MKYLWLMIALAIAPATLLRAQIDTTVAPDQRPQVSADTTLQSPAVQRKLLPDQMSFMERGLWGEHGLVRGIGLAGPLTPESRKHELAVRRTMLSLHQIGGFVTLGLMGATVYYGQRTIDGHNTKGTHQAFATATIISYGATAMLSVLSPPPLIRRDESSTTTLHKTLAWVHFAGMIVTPILASMIGRNADYERKAHIHQVAGYITTGTLALSMIVMTF